MTRNYLADVREINSSIDRNIHLGISFSTFWRNEDGDTIADNGLFGIVLLTGELEIGLNFNAAVGGTCEAVLYENPTLSVTGTPLDIFNLHRQAGTTSTCLAWHSPTVTTGTVLVDYYLPGGWTNASAGGMARAETHWLLNTGTFYVIVGINRAGSVQPGSVVAQWFEEDDG